MKFASIHDFRQGAQPTLADRASRWALGLLAALHVLLAMSFLLALLSAGDANAQPAAAEDEACGGENLLTAMQRDDPSRLEDIRAEAAAIPNGEGLLWKIEADGKPASWLYGTMHLADPRVVDLPDNARAALDVVHTVVIETDEIMDPAKAQATILAKPELTMFTDGTTLSSLMSKEDFALVEAELKEHGIPLAAVSRMKPWMIASLVALPECELERKAGGAAFLDKQIADDAVAAGKTLKGLETLEEQLNAMASLPMEFHIRGLVETISLGDLLDDVMATMTDLYIAGETGMIMPMIRAASPPASQITGEGYADFEERIILARNRLMAERAAPILEEGGAFIAVGALHLPGEEGLIELLRADGYRVTPAQ